MSDKTRQPGTISIPEQQQARLLELWKSGGCSPYVRRALQSNLPALIVGGKPA